MNCAPELFEELKKGREQPDAKKAAAMSFDFVDEYNPDKYNAAVKDLGRRFSAVVRFTLGS